MIRFLCLLLLLPATIWGQTIADKEKKASDSLKVSLKGVVSSFSGATGWKNDERGKWVSSPNRIPFANPDFNNEYYAKYELGEETFTKLEVVNLSIQGKKYYALLVHYRKAFEKQLKKPKKDSTAKKERFSMPEPESELKILPALDYYVMDKAELKKLRTRLPLPGKTGHASLSYRHFGSFYNVFPSKSTAMIKERIEYNITYDHPRDSFSLPYLQFGFSVKNAKDGPQLRFFSGLQYAAPGEEPEAPDFGRFNDAFFAAPLSRWKAFAEKL